MLCIVQLVPSRLLTFVVWHGSASTRVGNVHKQQSTTNVKSFNRMVAPLQTVLGDVKSCKFCSGGRKTRGQVSTPLIPNWYALYHGAIVCQSKLRSIFASDLSFHSFAGYRVRRQIFIPSRNSVVSL